MLRRPTTGIRLLALLVVVSAVPIARAQCVSLTTLGSPYTQNFDTLANSGTTNNLTIPGWYLTETGGGARDNEQYAADTGGSNTGDTYSYGAAAATERALGGLQSGTLIPVIGSCYTNNTGTTLTSLDIAYTGEQWRIGNTAAARDDRIDFQYSLTATDLTTGTWIDVNALDFTNLVKTAASAGALDGNNAANRTAVSSTISSLAVTNGATFWIRWTDLNATGSDDGLAVDDFSVTPQGGAAMPTLNIDDVSMIEGAAGTQIYTFAVTLTAPAGAGGVTFDIATADDSATVADNDYVANSLTGQTIPMGSSGPYNFNVTVNGDNNPEPTEQFFVNVTNITNATAGDTQGVGTITTDDAPPELSIDDVTQAETNAGTTTFSFSVTLNAPAPPGGVTFDIATADDSATAGSDYVAKTLNGQTIAAGSSGPYVFDVTVNGDPDFEPTETFFVNVTSVTGANVADGQGLGTITNDDAAPSFSISDANLVEGNGGTSTMTFTVSVTGAFGVPISVDVATADSSATTADVDYDANSTTLTFNPGDTSKPFDVTIHGDTNAEGDEQFFVNLTNATAGVTITDAQGVGIIGLDDPISISAVDTPFTENFDALTQTSSATTPIGWTFVESAGNANRFYSAGTGSSTAGDTYSFGIAGTNPITDRAFGGLQSGSLVPTFGAFFRNDTGTTITSIAIQYTGEEWRLGTASRTDRLDFQYSLDAAGLTSGVWTDVDALDFVTPNTASIGAKDGNAAANRTVRIGLIPGLSIAPGDTFWIRFTDFNASGADDGLAVDDFSIVANYGGALLSIDDVSMEEGDVGTTNFIFTVSLSQPAPGPAGVTFDIATADGTATLADSDYAALNLTGENIPAGNTSKQYTVAVNGDTTAEPTQTFFVNVTNISGALPQDPQGLGTIIDDDSPITLIHDIQGPGATSPIVGSSVTVRAIVTGVKSNGFFVQEEDAETDADPNTSEGIFVFTSGAPPAAASFGAAVQVSGTVAEFVPAADPMQPPSTELISPTVVQLSTGNPLPAAIPLTTTFPDPAGPFDQLEIVEHMRVFAPSITVSGPSDGSFNESAGTGTSNGRFHGVITGVARPFREAGIQAPDGVPSGSIPPIPRWDFNPERLRIESATIGGPLLTLKSGDVAGPFAGPLDYSFRGYALYPDNTMSAIVTPGTLPTTISTPLPNDVTVASFNLQRFFDNVDDPSVGDPILTTTAYNNRLAKASIAIRNHLGFPDIIGVQEVENLSTLQTLAAKISTDALANLQPDPLYVAYLDEGNDVGGIDVGFLVKTALVPGGVARVSTPTVTQVGKTTQWLDPSDNAMHNLNDRPSLVLEATVNRQSGISFPIVVINNHLRSLIGIASESPAGLTTEGDRVRKKRQTQAEFVANYVQGRLTSTPGEHIVLVGDFNAFDFSDGYVDVVNVVMGTPPPDNETVVPGDGVDLVDPDLVNLVNTPPPAERYSYVHEGNGQNIDHAIVSAGLVADTTARRVEHPRINADYPETERNNNTTALRISDHDPVVAFLTAPSLGIADFGVDVQHASGYATAGTVTSYTLDVTNNGPDVADASLSFPLPADMLFASLVAPGGWSCTSPAMGSTGTISCTAAAAAIAVHAFTVNVTANAAAAPSTVTNATASVSTPFNDLVGGNDSDMQSVVILQPSQYRATKTVSAAGSFKRGTNVTYTITIFNDKPFAQPDNAGDELVDPLPADLSFVSASATSGATGSSAGTVTWNGSISSGGTVTITIVATIGNSASGTISNQAMLNDDFDDSGDNERTTSSDDPSAGGTSDPTDFTVLPPTGLVTADKSVSGTFVSGTNVTYTIVLTNGLGTAQGNNPGDELTDVLPAGLTLLSASATSGTATANTGTNTTTWNGSLAPGASVTITIVAHIDATTAVFVANQASFAYDGNADGTNELSGISDDPSTGAANDATGFTVIPADSYSATKSVSGSFYPGGSITYTIVLTNGYAHTLADNPGDEFTDVLPPQLTLVSASATSGTAVANIGTNTVTWNGALAPFANVTITIDATINVDAASGSIVNQGTAHVDTDDNGTNESDVTTDDPGAGGAQPTSFLLFTAADVPAIKSVTTTGVVGEPVTYTIVITNNLPHTLNDNPGDEFTDVLPAELVLVGASADSGTVTPDIPTRTVHWNGSIASGGSVTITIDAVNDTAASGTVSNQGQIFIDLDDDGTNETSAPTEAPGGGPTVFAAAAATADIPALDPRMLLALAAILAAAAMWKMP